MGKMHFNNRVINVFSEMGTSYDEVKNLMFDLYKGELSDGITKAEAENKIREVSLKIFGLTKESSKVKMLLIPTNEELMIARDTVELVSK